MKSFWVIGGEYVDTRFTALVPGTEQKLGPFASFAEAHKTWHALSWGAVDNCHKRFEIIEDSAA